MPTTPSARGRKWAIIKGKHVSLASFALLMHAFCSLKQLTLALCGLIETCLKRNVHKTRGTSYFCFAPVLNLRGAVSGSHRNLQSKGFWENWRVRMRRLCAQPHLRFQSWSRFPWMVHAASPTVLAMSSSDWAHSQGRL
jgi:hypothetical protein